MEKTKSRAFGPVLKRFRTERKLTQEELAEKVGGQKFPNLEMLFALSIALGKTASSLIQAMEAYHSDHHQ